MPWWFFLEAYIICFIFSKSVKHLHFDSSNTMILMLLKKTFFLLKDLLFVMYAKLVNYYLNFKINFLMSTVLSLIIQSLIGSKIEGNTCCINFRHKRL